jgi:hypothetical protein
LGLVLIQRTLQAQVIGAGLRDRGIEKERIKLGDGLTFRRNALTSSRRTWARHRHRTTVHMMNLHR